MNTATGIIMLGLSLIALSACTGSRHPRPEMEETFISNITVEGSKQFSYSINMKMPSAGKKAMGGQGSSMKGGGMSGRGQMGGGQNHLDKEARMEKMRERLYVQLDSRLEHSGYCREGYIELDSNISRGHSQIRGECKEAATDEDRENFSQSQGDNHNSES